MMYGRFTWDDHVLSATTGAFLNDLVMQVLNVVSTRGLDPRDCNFVGSNDMLLLRDSDTALVVFSRSAHAHMPAVGEYDITQGDAPINQIGKITAAAAPHRHYFSEQELKLLKDEYYFFDPVGIAFSAAHLTSTERQETIDHIAELLVDPTMEDVDRKNRIVRTNPIFQGRDFLLDSDLVFVLMDFGDEYTRIYNTLIKPTVEAEGFRCVRSDDIFRDTAVIEDIWENINKAALIVAEISNNNANVMYELGICHTVGKNVMMLTQTPGEIPFNFRHLRVYPYKNDIPGSGELKRNISSFLQNIRARQQATT